MPTAARIAIIGTVAECQERVRGLARAGVTTHVIHSALPDPYSVRAVMEGFSPRRFQLS